MSLTHLVRLLKLLEYCLSNEGNFHRCPALWKIPATGVTKGWIFLEFVFTSQFFSMSSFQLFDYGGFILMHIFDWIWTRFDIYANMGLAGNSALEMMMIAFITFKSSLVPLFEGLWCSNSWEFELSGFRRNRTDDLGIDSPSLWPTEPRLHVRSLLILPLVFQ